MYRLLVFLFLLLPYWSYSQSPQWIESSKRAALFPQEQYLQGYAWQSGVKKNVEDVYSRLSSQAKAELIEAIQVEVDASSELQTKEFQDEFMQRFSSNTKTKAKANIVGLTVEKYYDKKEKNAYVFAYARKSQIVDYYMDQISEALQSLASASKESETFSEQGLIKEGIQILIKENKQYAIISEARNYLRALGVRSASGLKTEEVAEALKSRESHIRQLLLADNANTDALAYYLCSELIDQYQIRISDANVMDFTYSDTPLKSELSNQLKASFKKSVGEVPEPRKATRLSNSEISGSFVEDGKSLMVSVTIKSADASYSSEVQFSKNAVSNWEPVGLKYLKNITAYNFLPNSALFQSQCLERLKQDIRVEVIYLGKRKADVPIALNNISSKEMVRTKSGSDGIAVFKAYKVNSCKPVQMILVEPDLATMLQISPDDPYIDRVKKEYPIPQERMVLQVAPTLVYLESTERFDGEKLKSKAIEPLIKEKLSSSGFELTQDITKARYQITVNATARRGGNIQGLFFSYLDANLSVQDLKSGNEVINKAFTGQKQGGSSFEQAGMNAYKKTGDEIVKELASALFND